MARAGKEHYHRELVVFFIPGGLFLGLGIGLAFNRPDAGVLIGLGAGFFMWALSGLVGTKK